MGTSRQQVGITRDVRLIFLALMELLMATRSIKKFCAIEVLSLSH
jgi:hypothetical protein